MRQAIFVVVMVGAAFLGGAVANGPGLRWVQARLLDYMGLQDGGESASIDLPQTTSDFADPHRLGVSSAAGQPNTQITTPGAERQVVKQGPSSSSVISSGRSVSSTPSSSATPPPLPLPSAIPEPKVSQVASMPTRSDAAPTSGPTPALFDPSVGTALLASRSPSLAQPGAVDHPIPAAISLEPAPAAFSRSPSSSPISPVPLSTSTRDDTDSSGSCPDWVTLRRKMQSLGVIRYTLEGEPGGRVVFWCLIPLAGRQAVSQRFEGEGEDESHAAQAAIRRITLWRAARSPSMPTAP